MAEHRPSPSKSPLRPLCLPRARCLLPVPQRSLKLPLHGMGAVFFRASLCQSTVAASPNRMPSRAPSRTKPSTPLTRSKRIPSSKKMTESVESAPGAAQEVESQATTEDDTIEVIEEQLADVPHSEAQRPSNTNRSKQPRMHRRSPIRPPNPMRPHRTTSIQILPAVSGSFGLGGKKKKGDEPPGETPAAPSPTATAVASVSTFAPGSGLIEEEVIEGEEFDAPGHHHHKGDEHDLDEYEEETLQNQIRSGELGEMLQEAHLDHRIQLDFDEKNGEEDGEEEDDEEEAKSPRRRWPARKAHLGPQRDRGGRGRRGRGGPGGQGQGQGNRRGPSRRSAQTSDLPVISDLLKPGQEILVQIAKEPIAKKGARITSHIALPGRFLVFMPTVSHVGVSRKIASDEERQRLKRILTSERGEASGGFIVRTAAEGASEEEFAPTCASSFTSGTRSSSVLNLQVARPHLSRPVAHRAHST